MKRILLVLLMLSLAVPAFADYDKPGKGVTVRPARANWNTGYFHEAIVRAGLKELGYTVKAPRELQNTMFFQAVRLGDIDYWVNGWFPMHYHQVPRNFFSCADTVGYVMKAGGLQGYLVSKEAAEKYNITSLDDFKRPEVREAFDGNGDGLADLTACETGWGCAEIIDHHLEVYGLKDTIKPIKAGYTASMADTMARYQAGKPVLFYTWAPNWTIFKLKPGKDVVWINVPEIIPYVSQKNDVDRMTVSGVKGAVSDPLKAGFVVADIRAVANKKFMAKNPAATKFLELFSIDLQDINEQNTKMLDGEKSQKHIEQHAQDWIEKNRTTWDGWLKEAREAAKQ